MKRGLARVVEQAVCEGLELFGGDGDGHDGEVLGMDEEDQVLMARMIVQKVDLGCSQRPIVSKTLASAVSADSG